MRELQCGGVAVWGVDFKSGLHARFAKLGE